MLSIFPSQFGDAAVYGAITGALAFWPDGPTVQLKEPPTDVSFFHAPLLPTPSRPSEETQFFLRNKFVADPVDGPEINGVRRIFLELLSKSHNAIVYSSMTGTFPLRPDCSD